MMLYGPGLSPAGECGATDFWETPGSKEAQEAAESGTFCIGYRSVYMGSTSVLKGIELSRYHG
ncbi:hypothetical protein PGT21_021055 [Puccinia graminis f. sp. tritici]|uniref:Uncharacterized protein n=1 Tax=Puccinia graminis f. sp. tritici TaxID=56615 RepID=A0A5B0MUB0_PUCGR|nr:hypothetical protein PGT21_021055 [Puccinia graminis f. sp. tritici]KAA1100837.1 hypothetical protein PGTUg99_030300 [Puccinia graminis f. sp. tritici]